jgi:hypothetical protein
MPWVRFEPTISMFEWAKAVHALDLAATVIGKSKFTPANKKMSGNENSSLNNNGLNNHGYGKHWQ